MSTTGSNRVLGVGWGVFIIAAAWCLALVLGLVFYRVRAILFLVFTSSAAILSAILLALPRARDGQDESLYDSAYNQSFLNQPVSRLTHWHIFVFCFITWWML